MCDDNLFCDIGESLPIAQHDYCGPFDSFGLRSGQACAIWIREYYQKYQGHFLLDNLHGEGVYVIREGRKRLIYNGRFYSNCLEGYAEVIYTSGSFEGLFKKHAKFGPGVRSWVDGTQDVGLWNGPDLMRLSCIVQRDWVPTLATSASAKTRLLKYRNLVPIAGESCDVAKQILTELGANEDVLAQSDQLYNVCIRDPESMFFNKTLYDKAFFNNNNCCIRVAVAGEEETECENKTQEKDSLGGRVCDCGNPEELLLFEINDGIRNLNRDIADVETNIANLEHEIAMISKPKTMYHSDYELTGDALFRSDSGELWQNPTEVPEKTLDEARYELHKAQVLGNVLSGLRKCLKTQLHNIKRDKIEKDTLHAIPVFVTDLVAWNNEKLSASMLKHCFLHRNSEDTISVNVLDILAGNRKRFAPPGMYEQNCTLFLEHCSEGRCTKITDLLQKWDINPDVTDAKGNSGIAFAAARDKVPIVKILVNYGAKVDIVNDEGLTPLTICLLRYLAVQNAVTDWESAFLPQTAVTPQDEGWDNTWQPPECSSSFISHRESQTGTTYLEIDTRAFLENKYLKPCLAAESVLSKLRSFISINEALRDVTTRASQCLDFQLPYPQVTGSSQQNCLLTTDCIIVAKEKPVLADRKGKKGKAKSKGSKKEAKISPKKKKGKQPTSKEETKTTEAMPIEEHDDRLDIVQHTIIYLLNVGSDPNIGVVPMPALLLSIFTKNLEIVDGILKNKADPNIVTAEEDLNAIHILVSLPPFKEAADICRTLMNHGVDKDARTTNNHWPLQKEEIVGKYESAVADVGKTPLHLLCMRYDFKLDPNKYLNEVAVALVSNKANVNEHYLGHTPLSLAILRGNLELIHALLETKQVDPNQSLGENMGVPLTILILKRYSDILPVQNCFAVYDLLIKHSANPLNRVGEAGNAIEFMEQEHAVIVKTVERKQKAKKGGKKSAKSSKKSKNTKSKSSKKSKKDKKTKGSRSTQEVKDYLVECARKVLLQRIQCEAVRYLYDFIDTGVPIDDFAKRLARMLTPQEAVSYIQLLVHNGKIKTKYITFEKLYCLVELVREQHLLYKQTIIVKEEQPKKSAKIKKGKKPKSVPSSVTSIITPEPTTFDLLKSLDIRKLPKGDPYIPQPCLDSDKEKYKVCFYCCKKQDKNLCLCPECEVVYYCSEECNKADDKLTSHICGVLFYNTQIQDAVEEHKPIKLRARISVVRTVRMNRKAEYQRMLEERRVLGKRVKRTKVAPQIQFMQDLNELKCVMEAIKTSSKQSILSKDKLETPENTETKRLAAGQETAAASTYNSDENIRQPSDSIPVYEWLNSCQGSRLGPCKGRNVTKSQLDRDLQRKCGKSISIPRRPNSNLQFSFRKSSKCPKPRHEKESSSSVSSISSSYSIFSSCSATVVTHKPVEKLCKTEDPQQRKSKSPRQPLHPQKINRVFGKQLCVSRLKQRLLSKSAHCKQKQINNILKQSVMMNTEQEASDLMKRECRNNSKHRRIPKSFQIVLEQISKCLGDWDISQLVLPYACYSNGQLYYRFSHLEPVFNRTYSFV